MDEADSLLAIANAVAEYRGESLDELVEKFVADAELTSVKNSAFLRKRRGGDSPSTLAQAGEAGARPDDVEAARKSWIKQGPRSPSFKRWFGDWERLSRRRFLDGKPVASLRIEDAPKGGYADVVKWASNVFRQQGGKAVSPELGEVALTSQSVRDSLHHGGANNAKKVAFSAVKDVIEQGVVFHRDKKDQRDDFYIAAPVEISNRENIVMVLVRRHPKTQQMYLHGVGLKERLQKPRVSTADTARASGLGSSTADEGAWNSVLRELMNFNSASVSAVVNPDGTPKVVYHGTDTPGFTEFAPSKIGSATDGGQLGKGFYFSTDPNVSQGKKAAIPVYLSVKNPLRLSYPRWGEDKQVLARQALGLSDDASPENITRAAKNAGYDGAVLDYSPVGYSHQEIVAFDSTQIKSAIGNRGTFDPNNPSILAQKSKGNPIRGEVEFIEDGRAVIRAFTESRDVSTLVHELTHVFRRALKPEELAKAESALGVKNGKWTAANEERFARMFERYLRDGKAPNRALKEVFRQFKEWLTSVYRNLAKSPLKERIPPELREVFDTMLGGNRWHPDPAIRKELDGMHRRGNVHEEVLRELESLPSEATAQIVQSAKDYTDAENQWRGEVRLEYNTLFADKKSASGRARLVERRAGDASNIPGFDQHVQALRDGEFPSLHAIASQVGRGDIESGLFETLQGGIKQFEDVTVDEFIEGQLESYHDALSRQSSGGTDSVPDAKGDATEGSGEESGGHPEGGGQEEVSDTSFDFGANAESFSLSREGSTDASSIVEEYNPDRIEQANRKSRQPTLEGIPEDFDEGVLPGQQGLLSQAASVEQPVSTKNASVERQRVEEGLPEVKRHDSESFDQWNAEAARRMADNPKLADDLLTELQFQPRSLSRVENAVIHSHNGAYLLEGKTPGCILRQSGAADCESLAQMARTNTVCASLP